MIPADVNDAAPPVYADSLDIPVLFRDGPARRPHPQWRTAPHAPWNSTAFPASDGWYAPTTTWREIIKAATEVGRDVTPHLLQVPQLAQGELVARVSPLYAYLGLHDITPKHPLPHSAGRRLTLNAVYQYATERTAKNAVGYRLGMTMAEWACRSLMGLGQTWHLEDGGPDPALADDFKNPARRLPDLWGLHEAENLYWLIEAKGGNVGVPELRKGWKQLAGGSKILHAYAHRRILVGAAVRPQGDLFLTIDHDLHPGKPPLTVASVSPLPDPSGTPEDHVGDSDDALMATARAQMLTYLALRSAPASQLQTVALSDGRTTRRRQRKELVTPLERDEATHALRRAARAALPTEDGQTVREQMRLLGMDDFLTRRIPNTELRLGMSRRLFAACARLHQEDWLIAERTPGLRAEDQRSSEEPPDDETGEELRHTQRRIFRERQEEARPRIQPLLRQAYEEGSTREWHTLLPDHEEPRLYVAEDPSLLEAATPETYLALRSDGLPSRVR